MRTGKWRERGIACGAVLLWHVMVGWWLLRTMHFDEVAVDESALQIIYLDRTTPTAPTPAPTVRPLRRIRRFNRAPGKMQINELPHPQPVSPPTSARPLSAVFLGQALLAADQQRGTFAQHAFDRPPAELPGAGSESFRMRSQITPQSALVWVAKHLQLMPRDYTADPCPRSNENIGNLMAGQDARALQQELDFGRMHCRP